MTSGWQGAPHSRGDSTGSWSQKSAISLKKRWAAYRRTTENTRWPIISNYLGG